MTLLHLLALVYNGTLVYAGALVGTHKLNQFILIGGSLGGAYHNFVCGYMLYYTIIFCQNTYTRVTSCFILHTSSNNGLLGHHQRHSLTLHVRTHQSTVGIIVLQEGNHCSCNGNYHLGAYVHEVNLFTLNFQNLITTACIYTRTNKTAFLVQRLVGLCYNVLILQVSSHINYFVGYTTSSTVYLAVGCLNEAIVVNLCKGCQVRNQSDVGTFRCFNGAHPSIVAVMYVTNFKARTVTAQTTGAKSRQTTLMGQLC